MKSSHLLCFTACIAMLVAIAVTTERAEGGYPIPTPTPPATKTPLPRPFDGTICEFNDVAPSIPGDEHADAVDFLKSRLKNCHAKLTALAGDDQRLKSKPGYPSNECEDTGSNLLILSDELKRCVKFIDSLTVASPVPFSVSQSTFYVIAPQADSTMGPIVIARVVDRVAYSLRQRSKGATEIWVVGRPEWKFSDFLAQCQADNKHTIGALVIDGLTSLSGSENYVVWTYGWLRLNSAAAIELCPNDGAASIPTIAWMQPGFEGGGYRNGFPFVTVGAIAGILGKNSNQTTTTITQPTPAPTPTPSPGAPTPKPEAQTSTSTTITQNNLTPEIAAAAIASAIGNQTVPTINDSSKLNSAAYHLADDIMRNINAYCYATRGDSLAIPERGSMAAFCLDMGDFCPVPPSAPAHWEWLSRPYSVSAGPQCWPYRPWR